MQFLRALMYLYTVFNFIGLFSKYLTHILALQLKVSDIREKFLELYFVLISVATPDSYAEISRVYRGNLSLQNVCHFPEVYIHNCVLLCLSSVKTFLICIVLLRIQKEIYNNPNVMLYLIYIHRNRISVISFSIIP
jgi:hypothetical protein